jgi:hypothetical protein
MGDIGPNAQVNGRVPIGQPEFAFVEIVHAGNRTGRGGDCVGTQYIPEV